MAKVKSEIGDFIFYMVFGIAAIYGILAFVQPERYPILLNPMLSSLIGLVLFIVGAAAILYKTK